AQHFGHAVRLRYGPGDVEQIAIDEVHHPIASGRNLPHHHLASDLISEKFIHCARQARVRNHSHRELILGGFIFVPVILQRSLSVILANAIVEQCAYPQRAGRTKVGLSAQLGSVHADAGHEASAGTQRADTQRDRKSKKRRSSARHRSPPARGNLHSTSIKRLSLTKSNVSRLQATIDEQDANRTTQRPTENLWSK